MSDGRLHTDSLDIVVLSGDSERSGNLTRVLSALGHRVETCANIRSFRHKVRRWWPHVVFIDWHLPTGVPKVVLDFLQNIEGPSGVWIIGLADGEELGPWEEMIELGCSDFLSLPAGDSMIKARLGLAQPQDRGIEGGHDDLTGFANREGFNENLRKAVVRAGRRPWPSFAVLCFDVDNFKKVNDSLGHEIGDGLLQALAARVAATNRPGDTFARFGCDQFCLLVGDVADVASATAAADRLRQECGTSFDLDGVEVFSSVSVGIALWNKSYSDPAVLVRDAETALHRAKEAGRNSFVVFDPEMHEQVVATLDLENDLRRAIERGEFCPYFQPIVSVASGRITGFEALARWRHPQRGILAPAHFIDVAEKTGVIIQIDRFVVEEACRQLRAWQMQFRGFGPLSVSVNISTHQFLQSDLIQQIDLILRSTGLYGKSLKLEVTESVLMEHTEYASQMLQQLRNLDIGISIDDFGTGYSSFTYLRRFEIDVLKIDRSFVSQMTRDDGSAEIVATVATLAKNLGKETVAEGVETRSQFEALKELGTDQVQGFFIAPPLSAQGAEALLEQVRGAENHIEKILGDRMRG